MASTVQHVTIKQRQASEPTIKDRPEYLKDVEYALAVDTETTGFEWSGADYPFYGTISDYDSNFGYDFNDPAMRDNFASALAYADTLIFHNASFDIHMIAAHGIGGLTLKELLEFNIHDTDLLSRIVLGAEVGRFGLKYLAETYLDPTAGYPEKALKSAMVDMGMIRKWDQKELPDQAFLKAYQAYPDLLVDYALQDTRYTYDLFYYLVERATPADLAIYELERKVLPAVIMAEHRGVKLDTKRVKELVKQYQAEHKEIADKLFELNGYEEFNPDSPLHVIDFLGRNGITLTERTEDGQLRTDKNVLDRWQGLVHVDLILNHRHTSKFLSTYLEPMSKHDVLHPNFRQIGAWTGRMSCYNPNLQNIPGRSGTDIRSCFVPRDGHVFVVADFSSIELRMLAYYMADDNLWDIIESGDPFEWMGEQIYGSRDQSKWAVPRSNLKNGTYAIVYGAGGPKLAKTIGGGMSDTEGRALKRAITDTLGSRFTNLQRRARAKVEESGTINTIMGRVQYVNTDKSYIALSALIQGSAADVMKQAVVNVHSLCAKYNAHILMLIHDEIVVEVPEQHAEEFRGQMEKAMISASPTPDLRLNVSSVICKEHYGEAK